MVQSEAVNAFMKVDRLRLSMEKKGSRTLYFSDPHSTVCSRIWATPVESLGYGSEKYPKGVFLVFIGNVDMDGFCLFVDQLDEMGVNCR